MATPLISCPGCSSEIDASALSCPICMRPRTRKEILRDLQGNRDMHAAQRRRPVLILALLVLAGLGAATAREYLRRLKQPKPQPVAPAAAPGQERTQPAEQNAAAPVTPVAPPPEFAAPPPRIEEPPSSAAADSAPPAPEGQWLFGGRVYDLFSLKPIAGAALTFTDASSGATYKVKTNAGGRYRLTVPRVDSGYAVTVRHARYRPDYLEDSDPPLRGQSEARREQAAYEAAQSAVLHVPVTADPETGHARYDLVLIPNE